MRFLLDSNVLSELQKPVPERKVETWVLQNEHAAGTSELVIGELLKGAWKLPEGTRRSQMISWVTLLENEYGDDRLIPLDLPVIRTWAELVGKNLAKGQRLSVMDSLIAATALHHDLVVVTRNSTHFPDEVTVFNPWP